MASVDLRPPHVRMCTNTDMCIHANSYILNKCIDYYRQGGKTFHNPKDLNSVVELRVQPQDAPALRFSSIQREGRIDSRHSVEETQGRPPGSFLVPLG